MIQSCSSIESEVKRFILPVPWLANCVCHAEFVFLLILWPPNMACWYIIINQSILWKDWIAVFKIKVIMIVQKCSWMFVWIYCNQRVENIASAPSESGTSLWSTRITGTFVCVCVCVCSFVLWFNEYLVFLSSLSCSPFFPNPFPTAFLNCTYHYHLCT